MGLGIGVWLCGAWLANALISVLVWERFERPVPTLLKHLVTLLLLVGAGTGILAVVFRQSVTGIWATSGVVGLVFGLATRSLIADLFSGIALHLDPPFRIGDWIEWREGNEEILARVEQINWRSTRVHARDDTKTIFIPNSQLSTVSVTNVFAPLGRTRQFVRVPLDPGIDVERAMRVLSAAALEAEGPLTEPPPDVLLEDISREGLIFLIRYWHNPDVSIAKVRSAMLFSVMQALDHAGIKTARTRHEVLTGPMPEAMPARRDARWVLGQFEIFAAFSEAEIDSIAAGARRLEREAGAVVVMQGRPGNSLFFVMEGLVDVLIESPQQPARRVGRLAQGQYFGEMSLLTGEPRSATIRTATSVVLYEIEKRVLEPIFQARPELLEELAQTVARRQRENQSNLRQIDAGSEEGPQLTFATQVLNKIKTFFSAA